MKFLNLHTKKSAHKYLEQYYLYSPQTRNNPNVLQEKYGLKKKTTVLHSKVNMFDSGSNMHELQKYCVE